MAAPAHIAALQALMAHQQGAHTGLPGGLGDAMTDAQRAVLLTHASRFKCENVRVACTVAPDEPDAHETIHKHIQVLMHKLIASKWYLKELEDVAMEWLAMQFQGRAADHWVRVVGVARVTATTSGIGHNSLLYRCLRDMLLAYPATGIKANLLLRKVRDLPWKSKATVEQICITTTAYYEAYQRAVALTQHLDVTLLVPDQDWPTRFTEMQAYFPEWATKLVVDYPGRFNNEQACWTALVAEASRKAAGKAMGAGGGLSQLTGVCTAGDLDDRDAYVLAEHIEAGYCVVYCDDIAIFSQSDDPLVHLQHLEAVLSSLREHQLLAKGSKCEFMRREAEFLGFMVSGDGVRPLPSKIEAVIQIPVPETITHLRSFLGMCNFFRAHLPAFAEASSPLTELLKGSKSGCQRLQWTLECDHAFAQLKDMLTSAPLLRHFDPSLRTAVHIDASQHAVGAVLLQWEAHEQDPRPVCFLSRKLQGSQWHYDARNAEALAAQVALAAWRPLLYGVPFELVSDHASLRHLFQQKAPSARILRLCEFLAEFDFQEVQYVRGTANIVPDFLSRPWDAEAPDVGLHALSHPRLPKPSAPAVLGAQSQPMVLLLPVCQNNIAVFHDGRLFSLPVTVPMAEEVPEQAASRVMRSMGVSMNVVFDCVGAKGNVQFWRADILQTAELPVFTMPGLQWQTSAAVQLRDMWRRAHFDALRLFGVLPSHAGGVTVASLDALATSAPSSSFLSDLKTAQQQDFFLQGVGEEVDGSDHGTWRDFRRNDQGFLCYQREGDETQRICVPRLSRDAVLHAAHGDALTGHPGITRTAANIAQFFWWPNMFRDVAHFVRSCRTCAAAKSSTGLKLGVDSFSSVPLQPFTHWSMDLIGPLPKSRSGNDLIVTWVDRTSKLIVARALRQGNSSAKVLADLTFEAICCRFGLPARLTHDNDVRFRSLWKELWKLLNTKISCTSAYNPQADPAERANRQVLEALRAAVSSVTDFDQWDQALPHLCFGLNTHPSSATHISPFELAHGFPARVPLTLDLAAHAQLTGDRGAADYALAVHNRHRAVADNVAAAQVRLGRLLDQRATPAEVKPGDQMYLDASPQHSPPHQVPYKLANRWMGPVVALEVRGPSVHLALPPELGKISPWVNVRRLKFFEQRDADFTDFQGPVTPVRGGNGLLRYELQRIWGHRPQGQLPAKEYLVQWKGYDTSQMSWEARASLLADVQTVLRASEKSPTTAQARASAPKRAPTMMTSTTSRRRSACLAAS